jgi:hypothetical protein
LRALALALACSVPVAAGALAASREPAHRGAVRIAKIGPRPAGSRAEGPGHGHSRNVIGMFRTPASCLRIVMAHTDSVPAGPGANDNASGVGVIIALAPRLRRIKPACDVWLVATGAEERVYTGSKDHLGSLALARRVRARRLGRRLRWALSLDEVGLARGFLLRSPVARPRTRVESELIRAAHRAGASLPWRRDGGSGNSDHREFQLLGLRAAKIGNATDDPCGHRACDRADRLSRTTLRRARLIVERALRIR